MNVVRTATGLEVLDIEDLTAATSQRFESSLIPEIRQPLNEICLSCTPQTNLDCAGVAAILALQKQAQHFTEHVNLRVINAPPAVKRLLSLIGLGQWCVSAAISNADAKPGEVSTPTIPSLPALAAKSTVEPGAGISAFAA